jgi:hypothetical protein
MTITAEDIARLEGQEVAALEVWKQAAREWYGLSKGGPEWRDEDQAEGANVLTAQGRMRRLAASWVAAEDDLINARRRFRAEAPTVTELEPLPVSNEANSACRCYMMRNSANELESCIASDCPVHAGGRVPRMAGP